MITWYYNGAPLTAMNAPAKYDFGSDNRELKLMASSGNDIGEYQCLARNEAGNVTKAYELDVISE